MKKMTDGMSEKEWLRWMSIALIGLYLVLGFGYVFIILPFSEMVKTDPRVDAVHIELVNSYFSVAAIAFPILIVGTILLVYVYLKRRYTKNPGMME